MTITDMELENTATIDGNTASVTEAAAVEKKHVAKARKTKKDKEVKEKNTTIAAAPRKKKKTVICHPTYEEMIKDAILTLKERTGSSQDAIQKFIEERRKELPPTFRKLLLHNLKRLVASGKLLKVKASFKLPSAPAKSSSPKAAATSVPTKMKSTTAVVTKPKGKVSAASKSEKLSAVKPKTAAAKKVTVKAKAKAVPRATAAPKRNAVAAKPKATKKVKEVKERNTTIAAAQKKKKTGLSHPTYEEMIKDAIVTLKERTGSSQYAIQKLPPTFKKLLLHNLKRLVASGKLLKVKASFKLPSASAKASSLKAAATSVPTKRKSANILSNTLKLSGSCSRPRELEQGIGEIDHERSAVVGGAGPGEVVLHGIIFDRSDLPLDPSFYQVRKGRPSEWQTEVIDDLMDGQNPFDFLMYKAHREEFDRAEHKRRRQQLERQKKSAYPCPLMRGL